MNNTDSYTISWRCWYNNLQSEIVEYTSLNSTLDNLPEDGFQAMRLWFADGNSKVISGNDYYFFYEHPTGIIYGQTNDTPETINSRYPGALIKKGRYTTESIINTINNTMMNSTNPLI